MFVQNFIQESQSTDASAWEADTIPTDSVPTDAILTVHAQSGRRVADCS